MNVVATSSPAFSFGYAMGFGVPGDVSFGFIDLSKSPWCSFFIRWPVSTVENGWMVAMVRAFVSSHLFLLIPGLSNPSYSLTVLYIWFTFTVPAKKAKNKQTCFLNSEQCYHLSCAPTTFIKKPVRSGGGKHLKCVAMSELRAPLIQKNFIAKFGGFYF